jgi:hypothetical protein
MRLLGEDVGRAPRGAQVGLQGQRVVADRVAVGERGRDLVDGARFNTSSS